jgi:hypothetical protein
MADHSINLFEKYFSLFLSIVLFIMKVWIIYIVIFNLGILVYFHSCSRLLFTNSSLKRYYYYYVNNDG